MNDLKHTPHAVLTSILKICENCDKICVGNITSSFVELLAFVIRIAVSIEMCCSDETETSVPARRKVRTWLQENARAKMLQWLDEAKAAGDMQQSTGLSLGG